MQFNDKHNNNLSPTVVYNGAKSEQLTYLNTGFPNESLTDSEQTDTEDDLIISNTSSHNNSISNNEANAHHFEEHQSQILHVLPELKIGMDLAKVKAPAFLLEKRSLLEVFADCMLSHSDLFIHVNSCESADDRILSVLDWYLTCFHQISNVKIIEFI